MNDELSMWEPWRLEELLGEALAHAKISSDDIAGIEARLSELDVDGIIDDAAASIADALRTSAPSMLADHRVDRRSFERRIELVWGSALDLLYQVYVCCSEIGESFNAAHRPAAAHEGDEKFEALVRVHARACHTCSDIHALLRTGHSDAARARWRALHELASVAIVLSEGDADLARRFHIHGAVEAYKDALLYQEMASERGWEKIPNAEIEELRSIRDAAVAEFGKPILKDWGWASKVVGKERPSFVDIEKLADQAHLRADVRLANHFVHGGSSSARLSLQDYRGNEVLQVGPSNRDLAEPGHGAAISLFVVTSSLVVGAREFNYAPVVASALGGIRALVDETGEVFLEAHEKLDRMESAVTRSRSGAMRQGVRNSVALLGMRTRLKTRAVASNLRSLGRWAMQWKGRGEAKIGSSAES